MDVYLSLSLATCILKPRILAFYDLLCVLLGVSPSPSSMLRWFIEFVLISLTIAIIVATFVASPVFIARLFLRDDYFTTHESDL